VTAWRKDLLKAQYEDESLRRPRTMWQDNLKTCDMNQTASGKQKQLETYSARTVEEHKEYWLL